MTEMDRERHNLWEMEPTWIALPGDAILFPAVYTPHSQFGHTRFGIHADALRRKRNAAAEELIAQFIDDRGRIHATSITRPEVECQDVRRLVEALQNLDARNVNRDRIFAESPLVSIGVVPYRYHVPGGAKGYLLSLRKVRISF